MPTYLDPPSNNKHAYVGKARRQQWGEELAGKSLAEKPHGWPEDYCNINIQIYHQRCLIDFDLQLRHFLILSDQIVVYACMRLNLQHPNLLLDHLLFPVGWI